MNLFQQILACSKEFREHFEKEKEQEERIKALENGSGGGGNDSSSDVKKQMLCILVNPSEVTFEIIKNIGDDILSESHSTSKIADFKIKNELVNDGDTIITEVCVIQTTNYAVTIPALTINAGSQTPQAVYEHDITSLTNEIYKGWATIEKYDYNGMDIINKNMVLGISKLSDSTGNIRPFCIIVKAELHKGV